MKKEESKYLRYVVNFWSIVTFAVLIQNVLVPNSLSIVVGPVLAIYTGALALYSAQKEFERWRSYFVGRHPGEIYVVLWTLLLFGMFVWDFVTKSSYKMEPEIVATYIVVLGILAITRKSKDFFKDSRGRP